MERRSRCDLPSGELRIKHIFATHKYIIPLLKVGRFNLILSEIESAGLRISEFLLTEVRGKMKYDFSFFEMSLAT